MHSLIEVLFSRVHDLKSIKKANLEYIRSIAGTLKQKSLSIGLINRLLAVRLCTRDGTWTRTSLRTLDFKSNVSTNSTTQASNKKRDYSLFIDWSERRDSNSRPPPWQGDALPAELLSLNVLRSLIKTSSDALTPPRRKLLSLDVAYFKERFSS